MNADAGAVPSHIAISEPIEPGLNIITVTNTEFEGSSHTLEPNVDMANLWKYEFADRGPDA